MLNPSQKEPFLRTWTLLSEGIQRSVMLPEARSHYSEEVTELEWSDFFYLKQFKSCCCCCCILLNLATWKRLQIQARLQRFTAAWGDKSIHSSSVTCRFKLVRIHFWHLSIFAENALRSLLEALTSPPYAPMQHLEREQALAKQFAEILHFTLSFDELKVRAIVLGLITTLGLYCPEKSISSLNCLFENLNHLLSHHADDKSSHSEWLQLLQEDYKQEQAEQPAGEALETWSDVQF